MQTIESKLKEMSGQVIEVKVVRILPYGILCELVDGSDQGILHVSEMTKNGYAIPNPSLYFNIGEIRQVKVIGSPSGRPSFSIKTISPLDGIIEKSLVTAI